MLVLPMKEEEFLIIGDGVNNIKVRTFKTKGRQNLLGITAPKTFSIKRIDVKKASTNDIIKETGRQTESAKDGDFSGEGVL